MLIRRLVFNSRKGADMNITPASESITTNEMDEKDEELIEDDIHYNKLLEIINITRYKYHLDEVTEFDIDILEYSDALILNTVKDLEDIIYRINDLRKRLQKHPIDQTDYEHLSKRFGFETWNEYLKILENKLNSHMD
jgi:hypothetical protein